MMNKKGGEFGAGKWFIIMFIYFVLFILVVNASNDVDRLSIYNNATESTTIEFEDFVGNYYCNNPRYEYNADIGQRTESNRPDYIGCSESVGILKQEICEGINGCVWENVTTGFWFWEDTSDASCLGNINGSYYDIETEPTIFNADRVKTHNNTKIFKKPSVCNHPQVIGNQTLCNMFSCTWQKYDKSLYYNNPTTILNTVGEVFSFRYEWGFESSVINTILNILFVIIPLLVLIISIYYMIPILH